MNPEDIRRFYAEEIRVVANLRSAELVKAFAKVPRENFLGDGPWSYATPDNLTGGINYRETESNDPIHLYHNVPIAIDSERGLPNAPVAIWLDNLKPGGRLIVPLIRSQAPGSMGSGMVLSVKREKNGYKARFILPIAIYHCFGARDDEANNRLLTLIMQGKWRAVQSLRRDDHEITDSCCLHGDSTCLSALALTESAENAKRD
jgi:hypothetical protein